MSEFPAPFFSLRRIGLASRHGFFRDEALGIINGLHASMNHKLISVVVLEMQR